MKTSAFVIEVDGEAVGLAVRYGNQFRFISSTRQVQSLDHSLHLSLKAAHRAALSAVRSASGRRRHHVQAPPGGTGTARG